MSEVLTPFRWSFSSWEVYAQCPAKWKYQHVMKLARGPAGPAAERGSLMHDTVEKYIKGGDVDELHPAVNRKYIPIFDQFRNHPNGERYTEKKIAFDREWYLCSPKSENASCVAVLDAARVENRKVYIGEWKSGKPKETHADQRKLYAIAGWKLWMYDYVEVTTYYLEDTENPQRLTLRTYEGYEKLKSVWEERIREMQTNEMCAPRPGWLCKFCDYRAGVGGPCVFGGDYP